MKLFKYFFLLLAVCFQSLSFIEILSMEDDENLHLVQPTFMEDYELDQLLSRLDSNQILEETITLQSNIDFSAEQELEEKPISFILNNLKNIQAQFRSPSLFEDLIKYVERQQLLEETIMLQSNIDFSAEQGLEEKPISFILNNLKNIQAQFRSPSLFEDLIKYVERQQPTTENLFTKKTYKKEIDDPKDWGKKRCRSKNDENNKKKNVKKTITSQGGLQTLAQKTIQLSCLSKELKESLNTI